MARVLPRRFYGRASTVVAPELLNKVLELGPCRGRIVEVEAYAGPLDPASHAYRGPTARNGVMFGPAGHLYVYFSYGVHYCANAVTGPPGKGQAVLLRALEPLAGLEEMWARRLRARRAVDLGSGPGKLTQALGIGPAHNGADLVRGPIRILDDGTPPPAQPGVSVRIGISQAADRPWRWFVAGNPNVSRAPRASGPPSRGSRTSPAASPRHPATR
jgi:DNA-3-methyladenine glycosylase